MSKPSLVLVLIGLSVSAISLAIIAGCLALPVAMHVLKAFLMVQ